MHFQPSRRSFVRILQWALGSSVLVAACGPATPSSKSASAADSRRPTAVEATTGVAPAANSGASVSAPEDAYPFGAGLRGLGKRSSAKLEYANLPAGGTVTLLDQTTGPGVVSHLWLAINSSDALARERTEYQIYVDGEPTPSVKSTLVGFHAADHLPNSNFATRFIGYSHKENSNSYYAYLPIPFTSAIKIEIVNGSARTGASVFAIADYHIGVPRRWGRMQKLHTFEQSLPVTPYAWLDLMKVADQPKGLLWGVYLGLHPGNASFGYLEGNIQMFADGATTPIYESSGTEDYFNNAWYFQTGVIFAEHSGCTFYDPSSCAIGAYRFHVDDPIPFDSTLRVRWQNGTSDQAAVTSPTDVRSHVWYYTD